jgi:hypothetical protein
LLSAIIGYHKRRDHTVHQRNADQQYGPDIQLLFIFHQHIDDG